MPKHATEAYVDTAVAAGGGGGGQSLVTHVVAPTGGDFTTLGAAITAAAAGDTIYVRNGTYTETAINSSLANLTITGENRESTVLNFTTNSLTLSGAQCTIHGLKLSFSTGALTLSGEGWRFDLCNFSKTSTSTGMTLSGSYGIMTRVYVLDSSTEAASNHIAINGTGVNVSNCYFYFSAGSRVTNGSIRINGNDCQFTGCVVRSAGFAAGRQLALGGSRSVVSSNSFITSGSTETHIAVFGYQNFINGNAFNNGNCVNISGGAMCNIDGNNMINVYDGVELGDFANNCRISNNIMIGASTAGGYEGIKVTTNDDDCVIIGNRIAYFNIGIHLTSANTDRCVVSGNALNGNTTPITNSATGTVLTGANSS